MKNVAILGSTGSAGVSALDVCRRHPDKFRVVALAAGRNLDLLAAQVKEFSPRTVSVQSPDDYDHARSLSLGSDVELFCGQEGAVAVAVCQEASIVVSAIVGAAGLVPTMKAIESQRNIALANKESMVIAGELMSQAAQKNQIHIVPVDSEHSAIFQCLNGEHRDDVEHLVLTASGGPFWEKSEQEFGSITKAQALKHPNWDMGAKITIDSATMMNKGLEVIEAHWLFNMPVEKIRVVVHPQSIVHSMVEFVDGSVMAQLGEPDMRVPIAYALTYPRRIATGSKSLSLPDRKNLNFFNPDTQKFPCLRLAFEVAQKGGSLAAVLNAANEAAVALFLQDKIGFTKIADLVEKALGSHRSFGLKSLGDVLRADAWAREEVLKSL